jgi:hypothetical protein
MCQLVFWWSAWEEAYKVNGCACKIHVEWWEGANWGIMHRWARGFPSNICLVDDLFP